MIACARKLGYLRMLNRMQPFSNWMRGDVSKPWPSLSNGFPEPWTWIRK